MRTSLSLAAVLVCATGCQAIFGLDDQLPLPLDDRRCWGSDFQTCLPEPASSAGALTLAGKLDTSTSSECEPSLTTHCVIAANTVTIAALDVSGARPLIVIGADSIVVEDRLDGASHAGATGKVGPAAAGASCGTFAAAPTLARGGGAGGTFAGGGGAGGGSEGGTAPNNAAGGRPVAIVPINGFRAGCPGQSGGGFDVHLGVGGAGGGAMYLIAGARIEVRANARVNVSGAGGSGAVCTENCADLMGISGGGGGGGSGGMLILEAPVIASDGFLIADGGGGGEGATQSNHGATGANPDGTKGAPGGAGGAKHGGDGGAGSHAGVATGAAGGPGDSSLPPGGGGGGGGAGVIRIYGTRAIDGVVSPAPQLL